MKRKFLPSALRPLAGPAGTAARGPGKPPSSTPKKTPRHTPAMAQKNGSFFYKAVMTVVVTLLFSGLFGCGGTGKSEEVVSFYTSSPVPAGWRLVLFRLLPCKQPLQP